MSEFKTLTELGRDCGVTSHKVGRWLTDLGYRHKGQPTAKAFAEKLVTDRESTNPGTYFWVWHAEKTMRVLQEAGVLEPSDATKA